MPSIKNFDILPVYGNARRPSDHVNARSLTSGGGSEQISVPTDANIAVISCDDVVCVAFGSNPTAIAPSDLDDGTGSEMIAPNSPIESRTFLVTSGEKIAVITTSATADVTVSFYKQ